MPLVKLLAALWHLLAAVLQALILLVSKAVAIADGAVATESGSSQVPTLRQCGKCFRHVVGESHYRPALAAIASNRVLPGLGMKAMAALICENDNQFDANAVRVVIRERTVGYLSADDAAEYRSQLQAAGLGETKQWVAARIAGGGDGRHYGVYLDLPNQIL